MRKKNKLIILGYTLLLISLTKLVFSQVQNVDELSLEAELASRLETMIEKLIGKERALVKIDVNLTSVPNSSESFSFKSSLRGMPNVAFPEQKEKSIISRTGSQIRNILVTIYLDNKLLPEKIELVKTNVIKWLELDFSRGDSLKIELIPWKEVSPEDVAVKQFSFLKRNLIIILIIILVLILTLAFIVPSIIRTYKSFKEGLKLKSETKAETEPLKIESLLNEIKETLAKYSGISKGRTDELLEDIKELMAKFPKRSDTILEEIKDVLQKISLTSASAGTSTGVGTGGGTTSSDFLSALRETIVPFISEVKSPGGTSLTPEVIEILKKIENTLRETASERTNEIDEPFKYLNNLSTREISLIIEGESPRICAIILAHLNPEKSAMVLNNLPIERQLEISLEMASLSETEEVAIEIKEFLRRKLKTIKLYKDFAPINGEKVLADILSSLPYEITSSILKKMEEKNPILTSRIKNYLFLFEDIVKLSDKDIQEILKNVDIESLALALVVASNELREKFYKNTSERTANILKEEIESNMKYISSKESSKKIIIFEDIVNLDNRTLEKVLKEIDRNTLKVALKGASEEVREKFYSLLTERGKAILKEDLEVMPSIPREMCEEAQTKIIEVIKKLENKPLYSQQEILNKIRQLARIGKINLQAK